jgi:ribosomal protein S18 acetylase RimI-like enzyme
MATIRRAGPADAAALAAVKRETFLESFVEGGFRIPYPADDLAQFVEASYSEPAVAKELDDPERTNWVAEEAGRLLGYAHAGPCKLPHPDAKRQEGELYQLYLRGSAQGRGLGRALLDEALAHLEATRPGPLWIGVWSGNIAAQRIYAGRGFRKVGEYRFPVGSWEDEEFIFRRG